MCLVLGAGASLGQAQYFRPKQTKYHPPIDRNFFGKALRLSSSNKRIGWAVRQLKGSLQVAPGFSSSLPMTDESLEQFFADVYYEVATSRSRSAHSVFVNLLKLYNRVLADTTNWLSAAKRPGPLDHILKAELKAPDTELTVVTFNQDLLVENCAVRMTRSKKWALTSLYGQPANFLERLTTRHKDVFPSAHAAKPPFTLLKLHGSLNWVIRTRDRDPAISALFPKRQKKVYLSLRRRVSTGLSMTTSATSGRSTWYLWPLIVPPIYEKSKITGIQVLDTLWSAAEEALGAAEKVILVGYSLPEADVLATQLLRKAFRRSSAPESIECVNPDVSVVSKLKQKLACRVIHQYDGIVDYLNHNQ